MTALNLPTLDETLLAPEVLLSRLASRGVAIGEHLRTLLLGGLPNATHYVG